MKIYAPVYYNEFSCTASECKHTCCTGWEIDIDDESYKFYKTLGGNLGERLRSCISTDETPHFVLEDGERCPFLNGDGLCDIIISCGEDALCNICADHPRFRNFFSDRIEIGLGLCCEAAAKLITKSEVPFEITVIGEDSGEGFSDEDELELISIRDSALNTVKDRGFTVAERINNLLNIFSVNLPELSPSEWSAFLGSLERLDTKWNDCLESLAKEEKLAESCNNELAAENLLCYFLFRHLPSALYDGDISSKLAFSVLSSRIIFTLSAKFGIEEAARMYSSEIEYSDENLEKLFQLCASI